MVAAEALAFVDGQRGTLLLLFLLLGAAEGG